MIRWSLFALLALGVVAYSFWLYMRVELAVPASRRLALARATALLVLVILLFDVRIPSLGAAGAPTRWVLLDASLSMGAATATGSAWAEASERAAELERQGWTVISFGSGAERSAGVEEGVATEPRSLLAPALERAVESGVGDVRVLSDMRFEDAVAVRSIRTSLPLDVTFEPFGEDVPNAGVAMLDVPDLARADGSVTAEVEVHGGVEGEPLRITIEEDGDEVAETTVVAPAAGLRSRVRVALPTPARTGRIRYTVSVALPGDAFPSDDVAVTYASVGHEEGALVLVSLRPDWEPRYLLPVLADVTGLPALGYVRAGADRFVAMGRAVERGAAVDSARVLEAALSAALLVVHGVGSQMDPWARALVERPGRRLLFLSNEVGAELVGLPSGEPREGEWYVSSEIPTSAIAGALAGLQVQGLPPLEDVLLPDDPSLVRGPLLVQLRGAGPLEAALHLDDRPDGRVVATLGSGFWRWAARDVGREAYRRLWSGVSGWLLAGEALVAALPRPTRWVVARDAPVSWTLPGDSATYRIVVDSAGTTVVDTTVAGGAPAVTPVLPPGRYGYRVEGGAAGDTATGSFDVAEATLEMAHAAVAPDAVSGEATVAGPEGPGTPLRTRPWPYLLVITLLCAEWIGRRRSGLR